LKAEQAVFLPIKFATEAEAITIMAEYHPVWKMLKAKCTEYLRHGS
jgi:hypothetical protein